MGDELVTTIREDTDCLWTITKSAMTDTPSKQEILDGEDCYSRLKIAMAKYYEQRYDVLDSSYLWFIAQALSAYEDIHARFIVGAK